MYFWVSTFGLNMAASEGTPFPLDPQRLRSNKQKLFHELWHELNIPDQQMGGSLAFDNWLQAGCSGPPPAPLP